MATALSATMTIKAEVVFQLAKMSDRDLLTHSKADLATALSSVLLTKRVSIAEWGELAKFLGAIRFFREKAAKAAGAQLAQFLGGMSGDGGKDLCNKVRYCARRQGLRKKLERVRKAVTIADVAADIADIAEVLATIIDAIASFKLPVTIAFLAILYALDDLCDCASYDKDPNAYRESDFKD